MDLKLDEATHDLAWSAGALQFVTEGDEIKQSIKIRLLMAQGEFLYDTDTGVPYLEVVMVRDPDLDTVANAFRAEILEVEGVESVPRIELDYDQAARTLTVDITVNTIYGSVELADLVLE